MPWWHLCYYLNVYIVEFTPILNTGRKFLSKNSAAFRGKIPKGYFLNIMKGWRRYKRNCNTIFVQMRENHHWEVPETTRVIPQTIMIKIVYFHVNRICIRNNVTIFKQVQFQYLSKSNNNIPYMAEI